MALFTGYIALGTGFISPGYTFQEVSGGSYARVAASLSGTYQTGVSQTITVVAGTLPANNPPMRLGAIFDASTGGNMLCWWEMPGPLTPVGTALPSTTLNMVLYGNVIAGMSIGNEVFQSGSQIGFVNGNPLIAGVTLINSTAGNLTYEPAQGTIISNPIFMNQGKAVARFDASGNLILLGTVTATGTV